MDSKDHNKVIAFDTLFSTNHIQMLKIMLPYMDNQMQKSMAIYIKFLEFNYTMEFYKKHPYPVCGCMEKEASPNLYQMCTELLPYCTENEKKQIEQIRNIFKSMEMYQEMTKTMEMMKDFMPDMDMSNLLQGFGDFMNPADTSVTDDEQETSKESSSSEDNGSSGSFDMTQMLMNMLSPEQKEMFELLVGGNNHAE